MDGESRLRTELGKKQPFDSLEQEATLQLLRTSDRVQWYFARLFREHGLTASQYNILRILRGVGKPMPILEIASRTITVVPGITGLIDRLEQAGMVARTRCPKDRRVIYVALTEPGHQALANLDRPVLELHQQIVGTLSHDETHALIRLLEKLRAPLVLLTE